MTTDMELGQLEVGHELGDGGQGKVFSLPTQQVLKTYHEHMRGDLRPEVLTDLIQMSGALTCNGMHVQQWAAWPQARVTAQGRVIGFLMPRVPDDFWIQVGGKYRLASLSYLACEPKPVWGHVSLPNDLDRLAILARLAAVMEALHQRGLVIGDLSFNNVLWSASPIGVMLIDCDGVHKEHGPTAMPQADTIDWGDPLGGTAPPDQDRDRYKLSLAVVRVLARQLSATPGDARKLTLAVPKDRLESILDLFDRAAGPRGSRPAAAEWRAVLSQRQMRPVTPPAVRGSSSVLPPKPELIVGADAPRQYRPVTPPPPAG